MRRITFSPAFLQCLSAVSSLSFCAPVGHLDSNRAQESTPRARGIANSSIWRMGVGQRDDSAYFEKRISEEQKRAELAADPTVALAHLNMMTEYQHRLRFGRARKEQSLE